MLTTSAPGCEALAALSVVVARACCSLLLARVEGEGGTEAAGAADGAEVVVTAGGAPGAEVPAAAVVVVAAPRARLLLPAPAGPVLEADVGCVGADVVVAVDADAGAAELTASVWEAVCESDAGCELDRWRLRPVAVASALEGNVESAYVGGALDEAGTSAAVGDKDEDEAEAGPGGAWLG